MKPFYLILFLLVFSACSLFAAQGSRPSHTVILDETGVKNLRIETQLVEETTLRRVFLRWERSPFIPGGERLSVVAFLDVPWRCL